MLKLEFTSQFKRDFKQAIKRGLDANKLEAVVELLRSEKQLPSAYRDHALTNSRNYKGVRECHIEPDWLLIYKIEKQALLLKLIRTGSHSDLF
ncbi:type II toxin-antitoxin system RelE/ParE family toxin [Adlercreutzia murintestinalis]|jgi:addiction module toxin, RelE/StbE family|uniref:type II toxin-antitoxin system RelE/ParE family toxin n=1 Tax=Adlercreutzia murintestinalis TaxID=2941325 RepID=UPI00203CC323|nr:type II toxin-antitoxin system YafQ family toxin [Adlercreutzia murintestinalis]